MTINKISTDTKSAINNVEKSRVSEAKQVKKEAVKSVEVKKDVVKISAEALAKQKEEDATASASAAQTSSTQAVNTAERNKRIEQIKEQIRTGEFKVDSKVIADNLISNSVKSLLAK